MARVSKSIEDAFFASRRSDVVPFVINDSVWIVAGPHSGRHGAVIAILAIEPELELCVELDDGADVRVLARHIRMLDDAG